MCLCAVLPFFAPLALTLCLYQLLFCGGFHLSASCACVWFACSIVFSVIVSGSFDKHLPIQVSPPVVYHFFNHSRGGRLDYARSDEKRRTKDHLERCDVSDWQGYRI